MMMALSTLVSCGGKGGKKAANKAPALEFKMPQIPSIITDFQERAEYLAKHYWDNVNFSDTAWVATNAVTEQAFVNYIDNLSQMLFYNYQEMATKSMNDLMNRARVNERVYLSFYEIAAKYLYHPNSQMRNEILYLVVLENLISWDALDELYKITPRMELELSLKNRIGEPANNIKITLSSGATTNLYDIKANYTLLYFNHPECSACAQVTAELNRSDLIRNLLRSGELKIVAVYTEEELEAWRKHIGDLPGEWIKGYDAGQITRKEKLYDLRAIPALYLLDKDKRVILKDIASGLYIEDYFKYIFNLH